ncbi:hypothetical protein HDU98_011037 [Podochytrium sp. JEL0797]|nr:hypothetical protein HDU98_011037 [Podochytrium sp. JEL0797]
MDMFSEAQIHPEPITDLAASQSEIVPPSPTHDEGNHPSTVTQEGEFKRIIAIAVDGSDYAECAVTWASKNILQPTDLVVLLNARPFVMPPGTVYMDVGNYIDQQESFQRAASHKLLRSFSGRLKAQGFATKAIALKGNVKEELVRKAEEVHADLLVIGSRGLGYLNRALVGSVSDHCVHHCICPVLVIKPKDEDLKEVQLKKAAAAAVGGESA